MITDPHIEEMIFYMSLDIEKLERDIETINNKIKTKMSLLEDITSQEKFLDYIHHFGPLDSFIYTCPYCHHKHSGRPTNVGTTHVVRLGKSQINERKVPCLYIAEILRCSNCRLLGISLTGDSWYMSEFAKSLPKRHRKIFVGNKK